MKLLREASETKQLDIWFKDFLKESWLSDEIFDKIDCDFPNFSFPTGNLGYYGNGRDAGIVVNVKGRGYPDKLSDTLEKEIVKKYPKLKGFNKEIEKGIREFMNDFFESLFWDDVQYITENFDFGDLEFSSYGRSGGYWGVTFDSFKSIAKFEINKNGIKKLEKEYSNFIKDLDEDDLEAINSYDTFLEYFFDEIDISGIFSLDDFDLDKDTIKQLENVVEEIEGTVKDFKSNDRWIEEFDANDYWENILEYIDIDFSKEE